MDSTFYFWGISLTFCIILAPNPGSLMTLQQNAPPVQLCSTVEMRVTAAHICDTAVYGHTGLLFHSRFINKSTLSTQQESILPLFSDIQELMVWVFFHPVLFSAFYGLVMIVTIA